MTIEPRMTIERLVRRRAPLLAAIATLALLGATTLLIALLEDGLRVPNASAVYLVAVVGVAVGFGTVPAMIAAAMSFLLYDFLFIEPVRTFTVANPGEWLNLVLLLLVGIVVGQLGAAERQRATTAELRVREARALFQVSRSLATREDTIASLSTVVDILQRESSMRHIWIELRREGVASRIVADSAASDPPARGATYASLNRAPGDAPARWVRIHDPATSRHDGRGSATRTYRVAIEAGGRGLGAVWGDRAISDGEPSREETRMLAASADQVGQALEQDRLQIEASTAELARRADAVKTALLDSVSHDLRTPLALIRAAAGSLMDGDVDWPGEDRREAAASIDREAERLNRLVTNLLDLSRIEAGALHVEREAFPIDDLIETSLQRLAGQIGSRMIDVATESELPPVEVDPTFFHQVMTNLIGNSLAYAPEPAAIRIRAVQGSPDLPSSVRLTVEDGGAGVADADLDRLFEKFQHGRPGSTAAARGTGIGLSVVRGFVEAMGGRVEAQRSDLGGLAIVIDLPAATGMPGIDAGAGSPAPSETSRMAAVE